MPRGAKPGERRGGRTAGTPNRATVERALEAEQALAEVKKGRKLGKDMLWDLAELFLGMTAVYQPNHPRLKDAPPGTPGVNPYADEEKFMTYAIAARDTARALADFQSPRFRAVAIMPAPEQMPGERQIPKLVPSGKGMGALEAYQRLRDGDIIDLEPVRPAGPANGPVAGSKKANGNG
jgi:hypothetical protein